MRSVIGLLTREFFGTLAPIDSLPIRKEVCGIGLSDWDEYARRLVQRVNYTNTYYHREPFLDITAVDDALAGSCDFVLSTDVFEHVLAPVDRAFSGARKLLKPNGVLIMTVPYVLEGGETLEHFLAFHHWGLINGVGGQWRLVDRREDGVTIEYTGLVFHGGPGSTLEMRMFSRASLLYELERAGFRDIRIADEQMPEIGVIRTETWSLPVVARA